MSDETTQAETVETDASTEQPPRDESRGERQRNDQALPSIETWEAPWANDLNEPWAIENEVSRAEKRHASTG